MQWSVSEGEEEGLNWGSGAGNQQMVDRAAQPGRAPAVSVFLGLPQRWALPSVCCIVFNS